MRKTLNSEVVEFEVHFSLDDTDVAVVEVVEDLALVELLEFSKHSLVKRVGIVEARVLALKAQEFDKL